MPAPNPLPTSPSRCPLCGAANQCAIAAGRPPESCWCMVQPIAPAALAAVPTAQRGQICICPACGTMSADAQQPFAGPPGSAPI
ncbi:MAG: cysteine-rich CWC family protein [Acidovorax sp.]|uniref:cysteine-rich CWC family protein n=1 Tax=Acidovorax sp. TaxID=1872122 RepID=UPI0022C4CE69|nr:cysteine-rich CWC family protein [Acidovorax sp.]MCZ8221975.1 cysteine-rich CWC family protein [Acidovorax sp.]